MCVDVVGGGDSMEGNGYNGRCVTCVLMLLVGGIVWRVIFSEYQDKYFRLFSREIETLARTCRDGREGGGGAGGE